MQPKSSRIFNLHLNRLLLECSLSTFTRHYTFELPESTETRPKNTRRFLGCGFQCSRNVVSVRTESFMSGDI